MIAPPSPPLDDGTVRLVPLAPEHVEAMGALALDPEVVRFTYVPTHPADEFARSWVERYVRGWEEGSLAGFAVHASSGDEFLGFVAIVRFDPGANEGEIGYIVAPHGRGRGVAGRALALITDWALGTAGLARVELRIDVQNVPSARIAERVGYVREGVLRSVHFKDGLRVDLAVYSRLRTDVLS